MPVYGLNGDTTPPPGLPTEQRLLQWSGRSGRRRVPRGTRQGIQERSSSRAVDTKMQSRFTRPAAAISSPWPLVRVSTTSQLAAILTKQLHYPQYLACVADILGSKVVTTQGTFVLKRGCYCQGYQVEPRRPLRGVCRRLGEPRPELDIDLNSGDPSQ